MWQKSQNVMKIRENALRKNKIINTITMQDYNITKKTLQENIKNVQEKGQQNVELSENNN